AIGKRGTVGGELCFNTGMTGYQEIYTDPSYYGQIIVNTNAHIGNYGVFSLEVESPTPTIRGVVINDFSFVYSRKTSDGSLQDYLDKHHVVGIASVDTRTLVKHIREVGAMNAIISSETTDIHVLKEHLKQVPSMEGLELSSVVTTKNAYYVGNPSSTYKLAVIDYGIKRSILENFMQRDFYCKVFPAKVTYDELSDWKADGYFLSNGPGDPASMNYAVNTIRKILDENKPIFGICLGHQLLARAFGVSTYKMHHGHRGLNHPVKNLLTGKCEITSQNHGFAVSKEELAKNNRLEITHINLNDNTVEGMRLKNGKCFSVQYHPESSPGPHDSLYLFDEFKAMFD
ncbi:MAG: glutamine-hydrolyzing carbamoyl-phosphate synthase small subunit, partial [Flammeovirgaceae bacterium]|nr:glutamine-hydrolyzing carbamoyl-phosphate synthase small subunit [Flammeovirgaceae bacterium]